jgi:uncharacterized protein YggE
MLNKMMAVVMVALVVPCAAIIAQPPAPQPAPPPAIRVTGEATIAAQPDEARIDIGVVTEAKTAQGAASENAAKTEKVIAELRRIVGGSGTIKTVNYSLNPNYQYPREGGSPTLAGYTASNTVMVRTSDLTQIAKLIDAGAASGANNIQSLQFMLKDARQAQTEALQQATKNARAKADALASALGLKVRGILMVEENGGAMPMPGIMYKDARSEQAATPVESGTLDISASVSMTVEIGP